MSGDIPQISTANYLSNTYGGAQLTSVGWTGEPLIGSWVEPTTTTARRIKAAVYGQHKPVAQPTPNKPVAQPTPKETEEMSELRIVRVFIADVDENIPVEKRLLYRGEEQETNLTDQELFFEINIKEVLDKHNAYRITVKDKDESTKDNVVYLEKARIRDLKMTVVEIAKF